MLEKTFCFRTVLVVATLLLFVSLAGAEDAATLTNWALNADYSYSMDPHTNYSDTGGQLTDGVYGNATYADPAWVGHLRDDFRIITVDLGEVRPITEIRANFLQDNEVGVRYPQEVIVEISQDGALWTEVGFETVDPFKMDLVEGLTRQMVVSDLDDDAQYVRLIILVDVWVFIDEIEVLGTAQ